MPTRRKPQQEDPMSRLGVYQSIDLLVFTSFFKVAWAEVSDTIWRTTEAGMEEEDREV